MLGNYLTGDALMSVIVDGRYGLWKAGKENSGVFGL